jgi:hypothetical protein
MSNPIDAERLQAIEARTRLDGPRTLDEERLLRTDVPDLCKALRDAWTRLDTVAGPESWKAECNRLQVENARLSKSLELRKTQLAACMREHEEKRVERNEVRDENARLREEVAVLKQKVAVYDRGMAGELEQFQVGPTETELRIRAPQILHSMTAALDRWFAEAGAKNNIQCKAVYEFGGEYVVTAQKVGAKTPAEQRDEARALLARAVAAITEHKAKNESGDWVTGSDRHYVNKELWAFLATLGSGG